MNDILDKPVAEKFSRDQITAHVHKILRDPEFSDSDILKRFLLFVVNETLDGNSNRLKEYTIATNVLRKPANFKTHENCIVRIHGSRLRRALNNYYNKSGQAETIRIVIPRGCYIPCFTKPGENIPEKTSSIPAKRKTVLLYVTQSLNPGNRTLHNIAPQNLGAQLTGALLRLNNFIVLTQFGIENTLYSIDDMQETGASIGAQWAIATGISRKNGSTQINVQLQEIETQKMISRNSYKCKPIDKNENYLQFQIQQIVGDLEKLIT